MPAAPSLIRHGEWVFGRSSSVAVNSATRTASPSAATMLAALRRSRPVRRSAAALSQDILLPYVSRGPQLAGSGLNFREAPAACKTTLQNARAACERPRVEAAVPAEIPGNPPFPGWHAA